MRERPPPLPVLFLFSALGVIAPTEEAHKHSDAAPSDATPLTVSGLNLSLSVALWRLLHAAARRKDVSLARQTPTRSCLSNEFAVCLCVGNSVRLMHSIGDSRLQTPSLGVLELERGGILTD